MVYYRAPLNRQPAYAGYPAASDLPVSTLLSEQVLSLPMILMGGTMLALAYRRRSTNEVPA